MMPNTKAGGQRNKENQVNKIMQEQGISYNQAYEVYKARLKIRAATGGRNSNTGGFYANPELARIAGAKGGRISRRKAKTTV